MLNIRISKQIFAFAITLLFLGLISIPNIIGEEIIPFNDRSYLEENDILSIINESMLDLEYVYNITKALSYIIFTEYDEENGEIAKGREFGTKGEWRAADILYENMTELGLWTTKERIKNLPLRSSCRKLTYKTEVLAYKLVINNLKTKESKVVECRCTPSLFGPFGRPFKKTHNFSFNGLKIRTDHPKLLEEKEDYVLISGAKMKTNDNSENITCEGLKFYVQQGLKLLKHYRNYFIRPHFKGYIRYDFNNNTNNQLAQHLARAVAPVFYINGTTGKEICKNLDDYNVDFYLNQELNKSVISYNVIGQLNGTDPSKTVIVDCLYDSWWCQGTADAAMGMGIVMGIAKYFTDNNITPKYNIKFIGFGGEEYGLRGAWYHEAAHRDENIAYVVDLNQVGFKQDYPRLKLEIVANTKEFKNEIRPIVERTDYVNRTGNVTDLKFFNNFAGFISDDRPFALRRPFRCKTVCLIKGSLWTLHHRDGEGHTEGDVLKYFDWADVSATGEIALNITKYVAL
jgi:hypothetical protein